MKKAPKKQIMFLKQGDTIELSSSSQQRLNLILSHVMAAPFAKKAHTLNLDKIQKYKCFNCKTILEKQTYTYRSERHPDIVIRETCDVCPRCGDSVICGEEIEKSQKMLILMILHNLKPIISEQDFTLIRHVLGLSKSLYMEALSIQKLKRLNPPPLHGPDNCSECRAELRSKKKKT